MTPKRKNGLIKATTPRHRHLYPTFNLPPLAFGHELKPLARI